MPNLYEQLDHDIYCIDTGLYRHQLAACYLVRERDRFAFIDAGTTLSLPRLLGVLGELGGKPEDVDFVIPTHVHLDHAGGAGALMGSCPNARMIVHPKGAAHMIDPSKLIAGAKAVYGDDGFARDYGDLHPVPKERVLAAADGETIDLAGRTLTFVHTPGHANHHGCIFDSASRGIFTGDTFGIAYANLTGPRGRLLFAPATPVAFDPDAWQETLDRLVELAPRAAYLTHYGRLDEPLTRADDLRQSIRDLAALALSMEDDTDPERTQRLHSAVADMLVDRAQRFGCTQTHDELRRLLDLDIGLNAQGLEVWLQRRARRAAAHRPAS